MILQVGQTTEPRIPERNHFPTTVVCRDNPFDASKLNLAGLPESLFQVAKISGIEEFPDLNQTWHDVTMGIGHTLRVEAVARYWDKSKGNQWNACNFNNFTYFLLKYE